MRNVMLKDWHWTACIQFYNDKYPDIEEKY